jgi:S1-C subfamily serine protease
MKRLTPIIVTSLISAFLAVFIYRLVEKPQQLIIRETVPVSYVTKNESPVSLADKTTVAPIAATDFIAAANKSKDAVVSIRSSSESNYFIRSDSHGSNTGSGVLISEDGYIATNNHVVENGKEIKVTLSDNREFEAIIVGKDPTTDLALLKISENRLPYITFGNSDKVQVGEWVLAIGSPFRLHSTVTAGIVSAKGRSINILEDNSGIESFIQTDAAVNPGNSGGALVNTEGDLIGINTAIITYSGQYEGFSFAVPSNLARKVLMDLREFGAVQRGWLGVTIRPVTVDIARDKKLEKVAGIVLDDVNYGSAAEQAGLRKNDIIISVNNSETKSTPEFMEQVGQFRPGDKIIVMRRIPKFCWN